MCAYLLPYIITRMTSPPKPFAGCTPRSMLHNGVNDTLLCRWWDDSGVVLEQCQLKPQGVNHPSSHRFTELQTSGQEMNVSRRMVISPEG